MDNLTFSKIKEAIEKYSNIAIVVCPNPSVDQMGSALSLYLSLQNLGKTLTIASPTAPLVEVSSLVGVDSVKTSLGGEGGDLVVSFPYKEGEIEKVSYTRDDNVLNIVVKAGELGLNFSEQDVKFTRGGSAPELMFVIGTPRISDLGALFDISTLKDTIIINIDNHPDNQGFGDILMVSTKLSSVSEAIANLIITLNYKLDIDIAQNLMQGIAEATDNFQSANTSALAFEMVGILMRSGAQRSILQMSPSRPLGQFPRFQPQQPTDNFIKQQEELVKQQEVERKETVKDTTPPEDWLEPKIYKGSTNF